MINVIPYLEEAVTRQEKEHSQNIGARVVLGWSHASYMMDISSQDSLKPVLGQVVFPPKSRR